MIWMSLCFVVVFELLWHAPVKVFLLSQPQPFCISEKTLEKLSWWGSKLMIGAANHYTLENCPVSSPPVTSLELGGGRGR